jgi:hypothetical protein
MLNPEDNTCINSTTRNGFSGNPDSRLSGGPCTCGAIVSPLTSPLHESILRGSGGSGFTDSSPAVRSFASPLRMADSPLKAPEPLWQGGGALSPLRLGGSTHSSESELLKLGQSVNFSGSFSDSPGRLPGVQTGVRNRTCSDTEGSSGRSAVRPPEGGAAAAPPFGRSASFHEVDYTAMEDRKHIEAVAGICEPGSKERVGSPSSGYNFLSLIIFTYSTDFFYVYFGQALSHGTSDHLRPRGLLNVRGKNGEVYNGTETKRAKAANRFLKPA